MTTEGQPVSKPQPNPDKLVQQKGREPAVNSPRIVFSNSQGFGRVIGEKFEPLTPDECNFVDSLLNK